MLFNSQIFVVFFAVVFLLYWRLPHRAQNYFLLSASLVFYGSWNASLLLLLVFSASIDFLCARLIARTTGARARKCILVVSVVASLGILGFFKYGGFFVENALELARALGFEVPRATLDVILPVGISFYTFQSMSYTIDVYRRELEPARNYLDFLLYISFFPQLVAGPIERGTRLLPQILRERAALNLGAKLEGVKLLVIGYLQKVAIADSLAPTVERAFGQAGSLDSLSLLLGLYAFAGQIYGDFAGYSNIARGTARLLGFELMRNFEEPYLAADITEFWRRWHISLSTWLRDYLYIPLGGNRRGRGRTYFNLMATMLLGGLWHGAAWNFVIWGGLHGVYLAVHRMLAGGERKPRTGLRAVAGGLVTFHLVCFAWIFFRADSTSDARVYLSGLARGTAATSPQMLETVLYLGAILALDVLLRRRGKARMLVLFSPHWVVETCATAALVLAIFLIGDNHVVPFIYFQF